MEGHWSACWTLTLLLRRNGKYPAGFDKSTSNRYSLLGTVQIDPSKKTLQISTLPLSSILSYLTTINNQYYH